MKKSSGADTHPRLQEEEGVLRELKLLRKWAPQGLPGRRLLEWLVRGLGEVPSAWEAGTVSQQLGVPHALPL